MESTADNALPFAQFELVGGIADGERVYLAKTESEYVVPLPHRKLGVPKNRSIQQRTAIVLHVYRRKQGHPTKLFYVEHESGGDD